MQLTGLAVFLLALVCLLGIAEQWLEPAGMPLWRGVGIALLLCLVYEYYRCRRLKLRSALDNSKPRLGQRGTLALKLGNDNLVPLRLQWVPTLPAALNGDESPRNLRLAPDEMASLDIPVQPGELGSHRWDALRARVLGPLGLAWWPRRIPVDSDVTVVPHLVVVQDDIGGQVSQGERNAATGEGLELHHLREYQPGDPLRRIDWKCSARSGQLVTRVYSEEQHLEIMLVLDLGRTARTEIDGLSQFGHYANFCAQFALYAGACGDRVGLVAVADDVQATLPPQGLERAVPAVREVLMQCRPRPVETDLLGAALKVQQLVSHRCLVVLLTDLYGQSLEGDFGRSLRLWGVRHLPMVVGLVGDGIRGLNNATAVNGTDPYLALASQEYRRALSANALAAQRLGARPVITRPAELQSRVMQEYRALRQFHRV